MGLDHFLGHPVFGVEQFEYRLLLLGGPFPDHGPVAGAQVFEGPDDSHVDVQPAAPLDRLAVGAALKCRRKVKGPAGTAATRSTMLGSRGRSRSCRSRSKVARTKAFWDANSGRLSRPTGIKSSTDLARRDERNLQLRRLDGNDHGAGIQAEHAVQPGTVVCQAPREAAASCSKSNSRARTRSTSICGTSPPAAAPPPTPGSVFRALPPWPPRRGCRPGGRGPLARRSKPSPPQPARRCARPGHRTPWRTIVDERPKEGKWRP